MRLRWLMVLLPTLALAQPATMPEGFAGKQHAVLTALYPRWDAGTSATGLVVNGQPQHARLREARSWEVGGHRRLAVLIETWVGDACRETSCPPNMVDLGVVDQLGNRLQLVGVGYDVAKSSDTIRPTLAANLLHVDSGSPLIGVEEITARPGATETILRLFQADGPSLQNVFERRIRYTQATPQMACEASVSVDALDHTPYPLKVVESCQPSGRSATEFWLWDDGSYRLHGPASDAAEDDPLQGADENDE